jgi:hypothetical protein
VPGLEKENAEADTPGFRGRPTPLDKIATASNGSAGVVALACMEEEIDRLDVGCQTLLSSITTHRVGNRPNRFEPRRIKRRPKPHDLLRRPRHEYKRLAA